MSFLFSFGEIKFRINCKNKLDTISLLNKFQFILEL